MTTYRTAAHEAIANGTRKWGYIPDVRRPQKSSRLRFGASPTVPAAASNGSFEASILDQNACGSCTGHGTAQAVYVSAGAAGIPLPWVPSPRFFYSVVRILERADSATPLTDSGAMPTDLLTVLRQYGAMPIAAPTPDGYNSDVWTGNVNDEVSLLDLETGGLKLLTGEYRIDETASDFDRQLQACIAGVNGKPAAAGIGIFVDTVGFMGWDPSKGPISTINLNDANGGGHWLCLDYYYTTPAGVLVFGGPNSWGRSWGKAGHYEITAECLQTVLSDCLAFPIQVLS